MFSEDAKDFLQFQHSDPVLFFHLVTVALLKMVDTVASKHTADLIRLVEVTAKLHRVVTHDLDGHRAVCDARSL